jgi:hypothetical protein
MPEQIATIRALREKAGIDEPIELGVVTEMLYVGDATWDVGERTISGAADHVAARLREFGDMGVSHLQVRFRSRDVDEACDQIARFGAEVGPLL